MDIRDLKFADSTFDVAIDKGTSAVHTGCAISTELAVDRDYGRDDDCQSRRLGTGA